MTTTKAVVVCPACGVEVALPVLKVEVSVGDTMELPGGVLLPMNLTAELTAHGPHHCSRESREYKIDLPHGTAGM